MEDAQRQTAFQQSLEAERRAMARALQETVINQLNLLLAQANVYDQTLHHQDARMAVSILTSLARQALQQAIDLENTLQPTILDSLGLEPALDALALQIKRTHGVYIHLLSNIRHTRLPEQIELALFRITQDILEKAIKQANATRFNIHLSKNDDQLTYTIDHDGRNLELNFSNISTYVESLSGNLTISTDASGSQKIHIEFTLITPADITEREMEVLLCLTDGLTNKEIAHKLEISPRTVKFHLDNLYSKLGVNTRTEAAVYALNHGWKGQSER